MDFPPFFSAFFENALENAKAFSFQIVLVGVVFLFVERVRPAFKLAGPFKRDNLQELGMAALNALIFNPLWTALVSFLVFLIFSHFVPYQFLDERITALPLLVQVFLGALIIDFSTYWRHRFTHNYMWPFHAVHHGAEEINWLTNLRLHPVDILTAVIFDTTLLYFVGFGGSGIVFTRLAMMFYGYFAHANLDFQFDRPMRYVFASPNFHRWHHANTPDAYNKNFCSVFSFLDLAFGTYYHPEQPPAQCGLSPREQKEFPLLSLWGQLLYPFRRVFRAVGRIKTH